MRDMVEIGMGRTARRTYELDDINIVPSRRTRSSQDVSTAWQLDAYRFEIPVVSHPTDALVSPEFAIELGRLGGLGVLNGEGLIGRHADVEEKIAQVVEAAEKEPEPSAAIRLLQQLHSAPLDPDLLGAAVARIREAGVTTAVRVSPQNAQSLTPSLVAAGIDLLVIQGTIISAERVAQDGEPLNLKTFISELDVPVVAGGVLDHRTALHLMRTGAAGVIVGYGSTQRRDDQRRGAGHQRADGHRDRRRRRRPSRISRRDRRPLRARAGRRRHPHLRRPGQGHRVRGRRRGARHPAWRRRPRRSAAAGSGRPRRRTRRCRAARCCRWRSVSGRRWSRCSTGPSDDPFGSLNLVGGLRRSMAKAGYCDLKEFQKVGLTVGS